MSLSTKKPAISFAVGKAGIAPLYAEGRNGPAAPPTCWQIPCRMLQAAAEEAHQEHRDKWVAGRVDQDCTDGQDVSQPPHAPCWP